MSVPYCHRDIDTEKALTFYRLTLKTQLAMYNGIIMSWREKVNMR